MDIMRYQVVNGIKTYDIDLELCGKIKYRDYWIKHHYSNEQTVLEIWSGGKEPKLQGIASTVSDAMEFIDSFYVNMFL